MNDKLSVDRVNKLHAKVRDTFKMFIEAAERELGITLRVTSGYRGDKEQQALYDKGRTEASKKAKEKIVTYAKPGQSYHNYGLAIDVVRMDGNTPDWRYDLGKLEPIAERYGIKWGGRFSKPDNPHFEMTLGYTWQQLSSITKDRLGLPLI